MHFKMFIDFLSILRFEHKAMFWKRISFFCFTACTSGGGNYGDHLQPQRFILVPER